MSIKAGARLLRAHLGGLCFGYEGPVPLALKENLALEPAKGFIDVGHGHEPLAVHVPHPLLLPRSLAEVIVLHESIGGLRIAPASRIAAAGGVQEDRGKY